MKQSTSFAQVATNQFDYLSSALCANTPPCKKHSSSRKFLTLSISLRLLLVTLLTLTVIINAQAETIASWGCISISANTNYKAIDGDANNKNVAQFSSSKAMTTSGKNAYYGSSAGGAVITFSNLDLSNYTDVMIYFYSRASKAGSFSLSYSTDGTSFHSGNSSGILAKNNTPTQYSIALPSNSEDITTLKLSHSASSGSLYFGTVTITGTKKAAASYTITPQSNNTSYGTVSLNGTTITATPKTGYRVSTSSPYTISPASSATVTQNGNTFTVTPSANTTITINFEALPKYIVTLKDDNSTLTQSSAGGSVTLPTREGCAGYTFAGWTSTWTSEQTTWTTIAPTIIPTGPYTPTKNVDFYPVYTKTAGGGTAYEKVTTLTEGVYVMVSEKTSGTYKYMPNTTSSSSNPTLGSGITMNNGKTSLTNDITEAMLWDLTATGTANQYYLRPHGSTTIGLGCTTSTGANIRISSSYKDVKWTITTSTNYGWQFKSNATNPMYLAVYNDDNWRNYKDATINQNGKFYLFKQTSSSTTSYISVPDCDPCNALQAPNVTATATANSITLSWAAVSGATSYNIYNYTTEETDETTELAYTFNGLDPNTEYEWEVEAVSATCSGKGKKGTTTTLNACEKLGAATGLTVETDFVHTDGQTYVKFNWTPADNTKNNAASQKLCFGKVGEAGTCVDDLANNITWTGDEVSKLEPGTYWWSIQALGDGVKYCDGEVISGPNFTIEEPLTDNCRWVEIPIEDITPKDEIVVTMGDDKTVYALGTETIDPSPKSQAITITSGMIDINQDFDYSQYTWSISAVTGGYQLQPYGTTQYLYGVASYITISSNPTTFSIFTSPENGNKCFMYTIEYTPYYLGHGTEDGQTAWKRFPSSTNLLKSNTLKFYKKACLPANKFWIDYELANVTCTNTPPHSQIDQTGEDLLLEFSANDGYKLPETISVKMGETEIGDNENYCAWDKETGDLLIAGELITDNITITIEGCERLAAPENLLATNITSTSAVLSWDAVAKADEYIVFVTDGETNLEIPTTNCTITIEGLSKNTYYLWDVTATADNYCDSKKPSVLTNEFTTLDVYTVTFTTNGGTAVEPQPVEHGGKATKPANPTKTGYTFAGWYTEAECTNVFDFNTPITSPTTIYAKWNANQYTITFLKQWGNGGTDNATVTFNSNNFSVVTIELPTRDGYEFGGYYTETGGAGLQIVDAEGKWLKNKTGYLDASGNWIKAESVNLYAKWTKIHTITWVVNNNTETPHHTSTALYGSTIDALPMPPADDLFEDCEVNAFVGWSTDNIGLEPDPTAPTDLFKTLSEAQSKIGAINGDKKFYAVYASEIEQIATFEADGLNGLSANSTLKWTHDNSGISLAISAGQRYTGSPKTFTITNGTSNYCEIVAPEDKSLKKAVVSITDSKYKVNSVSSPWSLSTSSTTQTITTSTNATDLKMYATSSNQIRITQVDVTYTTYSNYITRCTALPDPVWGGATIDKTEIAVNCGETSSSNGAAKISFLKETNFNLYKDITVEVTSGNFIIASSRDGEYSTSVTLTPTQSGTNVGTLDGKYVYVRAVAPPMSSNQLTGTITISGKQITTQVINVTATVTCNEYTLTFNDCGDTKTISNFAGTSVEEMEPWAETCSEPFQYVFDGWATAPVTNGTEEYGKVDFSTFTMPNNNTTILYAVYRYAEEGGEPVNGYVKVTEALTDWSGDYVIVDDEFNVAIQNTYEEDTKDNKTLKDVSVTIKNDKIVSPTNDIIWTISKYGEYYTVYNAEAIKYAGITKNETRAAGLSETIATGYSMNIIFDSNTKIAKVSSTNYNRCFSYSESYPEWRTYSNNDAKGKTGYLYRFSNKTIRYTSSLVCRTIEAKDAIVTSTVGQIVKVNVPITLGYSGAASITGTSDNEAFTVVTKNDVAVGESNIEVHYKPTAYVNTANQEETATITLTTSNGATTTFNVTGRCLPETFAIVAKVGNIWYALPSQGLNSTTPPAAYPVEVDDMADPTAVTSVPANADWSLRQVYASSESNDRFADNGEKLVFVNDANPQKALNAGSTGNYLLTDAQDDDYHNTTTPGLYEWTPTTTDLETYQLTNEQRSRTLSVNTATVFGVHSDNKATTEVRFLPIQNRYTPAALQVVEWKENSVVIMYNGDPAQTASVSVNGAAAQNTTLSAKQSQCDIAVYELAATGLAANPTQRLSITIGAEKTILSIPYIINSETTDFALLPGSTVPARQEVAKVSDMVILKEATLTAAGAKGNPYKFRNVTVYGGGKLVVPVDNGFGVNSLTLRIGGVTAEGNYDYVYPQFVLNGTWRNTSGKINLDYLTTKEQYYTFVAPFEVKTKDIKYPVDIYGSNVAAANKGSFEFQYYDGAARAEGNTGWKVVEEDPTNGATLTAHQGYTFLGMPTKVSVNGGSSTRQKFGIHRIPMTVRAEDDAMPHENSDQSAPLSVHLADKNNDSGWNLIGNPYMATISGLTNEDIQVGKLVHTNDANGNWTGGWHWDTSTETTNQRFLVIPSNDGQSYEAVQASNATLPAFKNFFVQISNKNADALSIPVANRVEKSLAPARYAEEQPEKDVEVAIVLEQDEAHSDQMDFLINNIYTEDFERDADFTKMMNATNLNLYGVHPYDNLSFVAMDKYTAQQSVAIGYQVPAAGEYTLRMSDKAYVMFEHIEALYVTDHEMSPEQTVDIMEEPYTFHVAKAETNNTRFTVSLKLRDSGGGVVTGFENVSTDSEQPFKFFYQDKLYIMRNGLIYDATGKQVHVINE